MNRKERRKYIKFQAAEIERRLNQALQYWRAGTLEKAEAVYRQILSAEPAHAEAMHLFAGLLIQLGRTDEAIALLHQAAQLRPRDFSYAFSLADALRMAGRHRLAIECYNAAILLKPECAEVHHGLGTVFRALERERDAAACFQKATELKPDWALAWQDLGMMLAVLGELSASESALERAISLEPQRSFARRHLAAMRQNVAAPEEIALLSARAKDMQTPLHEKIDTLFTLGRLADKSGQFDLAFQHVSKANALLREAHAKSRTSYNPVRMTQDVDRLISRFTLAHFESHKAWGSKSELPVFIVSMPRAGSTLIEQIAATHSEVFGLGEYRGIGEITRVIGREPSASWSRENIDNGAARYLKAVTSQGGAALRIIDKMPDNIFQLGLIATLFPNARVIFCNRDPLDICLSCFFQNFSQPYAFDTDLEECAHRYLEVGRLVEHWNCVLPLKKMILNYEALLADFEQESRRLIEFLGLEWDPQCLSFHETDRTVRTASWAQVRQPLYSGSRERWRNYEAYLGPARQILAGSGGRLDGKAAAF